MTEREEKVSLNKISREKVFSIFAYLSILFLIPLFLKKDNHFVLFHTKQGLVLFIIEFTVCLIRFIPVIGEVIFIFGMVICSIFSFTGIIKVCIGELWEMPVIFDIAEKFKW